MAKYELLLGADPEIFLKKGRSYSSAHGVIPGTKNEPFPVEKGAVQVDGMAVEFNISPAKTPKEFTDNINTVMEILEGMVGDHRLIIKPSVKFNAKVWENVPEDAKILGCDPDYNAYTHTANERPDNNVDFRTAAGHIHIGWTNNANIDSVEHRNECETIVKELDIVLGLPSLLLDTDTRRRKLYGKAGAYRPKPYGVEYRVLSNFWLLNDKYKCWIFNVVEKALDNLNNGKGISQKYPDHKTIIQRSINLSDKTLAKTYMKYYKDVLGWNFYET